MTKSIVVITGAAGFIGSSVNIDLAKDFQVIAIDRRKPSEQLIQAAPQTIWHILDIADEQALSHTFALTKKDFGQIDFVIHLAAHYDFENEWNAEYQRTNVEGTARVLELSKKTGVKRLLFASSIAAMKPPATGSFLTEESPTAGYIPYARSKFLGEQLLAETAGQLPCTILRIAGVYSDWCELPPLYSLIKLWTSGFPKGHVIPGQGESGIPYIHITDLVRIFRKCVLLQKDFGSYNIFLASQQGAVLHRELYPAIKSASGYPGRLRPIYLPGRIVRIGLWVQAAFAALFGYKSYERAWMLDYIDKPWTVDTRNTRRVLGWDCSPELDVLRRIPEILNKRRKNPKGWEERNISRNERRFSYEGKV
jgi:nucleoside-diphosphate-sugar epimerase